MMTGLILAGLVAAGAGEAPSGPFEPWFEDRTLRMDYFRTGTRSEEIISLDAFRLEPGAWAGPPERTIDTLDRGSTRVVVADAESGRRLYTRAYSTLFEEWRTTEEAAKGFRRTLHESALMPLPKRPVTVTLQSRGAGNVFQDIFSAPFDPASHLVERTTPPGGSRLIDIEVNGPPADKVDILFLGDGYSKQEADKLLRDVRRFTRRLFSFSPFKEHRRRFNVRAVAILADRAGVGEPRKGVWRDNPIGSSFNTFDTERYMTTLANRKMRDAASGSPYDRVYIIVNTSRYGGGGLHDMFAAFAADNEFSDYLAIHEFGHAFAGLGDEYFTSDVAYNEFYPAGVEPWEPNISALVPAGRPKWDDMVTSGVPVPTPPDPNLGAGVVGAFEGAGYAAKGLYRPALDCQMFSKGDRPFDPVCRRAIEQVIDFYASR